MPPGNISHPAANDSEKGEHSNLFDVDIVEYVRTPEGIYPLSSNDLLRELEEMQNDDIKRSGSTFLLKILENILLNPRNLSVRRIRESNSVFVKNVSKHELFPKLLKSFGFVNIDGSIVLQIVDLPRLLEAYKRIIKILLDGFNMKYKSLETHFFDPFKAYCHSSDINASTNNQQFEISKKDEIGIRLREQTKQLSEPETKASRLSDWNPIIYMETKASNIKSVPEESSSDPPSLSLAKMYSIGKNENFESKSKKKLKILENQAEILKKCPNVQIKLRFPESTIMMIQPSVKTQVYDMRKQIQTILLDTVTLDQWYLTEMPIRRKIDDNKTLIEEDIVYKAVLHFCFSGANTNFQVIKQEYLTKFLSKE